MNFEEGEWVVLGTHKLIFIVTKLGPFTVEIAGNRPNVGNPDSVLLTEVGEGKFTADPFYFKPFM